MDIKSAPNLESKFHIQRWRRNDHKIVLTLALMILLSCGGLLGYWLFAAVAAL